MAKPDKTQVPHVLLTFNGGQDPFAKSGEDGPVLSLLGKGYRPWRKIVLFFTPNLEPRTRETAAIVRERHTGIEIVRHRLDIDDPTHYETILKALRQGFDQVREDGVQYYISATSGAPTMHACWLLLAAGKEIPARIIQVRDPRYISKHQAPVTEIDPRARSFPTVRTRIAMEELPAITQGDIDRAIEAAGIIGAHSKLMEALDMAARAARSDVPILILGDNGTGKESLARFIQKVGDRREKPFVTVNCGAISEHLIESELFGHKKGAFTGAVQDKKGAFDEADHGTLFLDEIGEMHPSAQVSILRALQEGEIRPVGDAQSHQVNVRIIAATNVDIDEAIRSKKFREDLYHRLSVIEIHLPSLNERQNDIQPLADNFLKRTWGQNHQPKKLSPEALAALERHHWSGNIRELKNVIERAVLLSRGEWIRESDLRLKAPRDAADYDEFIPVVLNEGFYMTEFIDDIRDRLIEKALEMTRNKRKDAAALLGVTPQSISNHIRRKARK